jgi:hypothetical protein
MAKASGSIARLPILTNTIGARESGGELSGTMSDEQAQDEDNMMQSSLA